MSVPHRLHGAVALAHWYIGQASMKMRNGHQDDALVALSNADKFVSVIGREIAPDLEPTIKPTKGPVAPGLDPEPLPESLRQALIAHGLDPDGPHLISAESWAPACNVDLNDPEEVEKTQALVDETLDRMGVESPSEDDEDDAWEARSRGR